MRVKKSSLIFVCSMGELFGPWVPRQWIDTVMNVTRQCPQHTFQFLTKCPTRLAQTEFGHNCWVGTSIDSHKDLWRKEMLLKAQASVRFISFEPLLGDMGQLDLSCIDWVIIGAQTGPRAIKPESIWVQRIINDARHAGVPVFIKDNVHWPRRLREWPRVLPPLAS
jgi:protein gp37